jgi:hypothetical protein
VAEIGTEMRGYRITISGRNWYGDTWLQDYDKWPKLVRRYVAEGLG